MNEIHEKYKSIAGRLKSHDAARKLIEAELLALQHICPHTNYEEWTDSGWGRMSSNEWYCKDCGLRK